MRRIRVIPVLTLQNEKLVKTVKFKNAKYIGDPINAVKIFNEKEVDEIIILDITATKEHRIPNYKKIEEIASEAFMPLAYGGGINSFAQIEQLFLLGIEKIILNSCVENNLELIDKSAKKYGSQSIVIAIDVKKNLFRNYQVVKNSGSKKIKTTLINYLNKIEKAGAGEIMITAIDRDGTYLGYDNKLTNLVAKNCNLPVVACGGANAIKNFKDTVNQGASAVAVGSLFVFSAQNKGVLINYPSQEKLIKQLFNKI